MEREEAGVRSIHVQVGGDAGSREEERAVMRCRRVVAVSVYSPGWLDGLLAAYVGGRTSESSGRRDEDARGSGERDVALWVR